MPARARWTTLPVGAVAALVAGAVIARPGVRTSFVAAYRAFRDPSLVDARPAAAAAPAATCAPVLDEKSWDTDLAQTLGHPAHGGLDDGDDVDGTSLRELTLPDLHVPITRRTMRVVRFLTHDPRGRALFLQRFRRAALYRESVAFTLREAGLPEDLLWLAAVESGFDPRAVSPAGAAGLWQMMPATGQLYGLEQTPFVDERRSLGRATHAAVTHLRDLFERFRRWDLALAAYNAGYDRIAAAVEKVANDRRGDPVNVTFGDLAAARAIPHETIEYVPQIAAFAIVAANRTRFGLDVPELGQLALEMGEIAVPEGTRLRTIARAAGVSVAVLREYNPQLLRDRVPPVGGDYLVSLPEARVPRALASFPSYSDQEIVARDDGDEAETTVARPLAAGGPDDRDAHDVDDVDEPLPRRPAPLGRNRLPELPQLTVRREGQWMMGFSVGMLDTKLPASLATPDIGWQRADHFGGISFAEPAAASVPLMPGGYRAQTLDGPATRDAAIEAQLGFLRASSIETLQSFSLPNGITVRVRKDRGAPSVSVTVRVATRGAEDSGSLARGAELGSAEALHTITVDKADADAAIELGAARLRLLLGDAGATQPAEIRFRAGAARRRALQETPYGSSWIALGDALFPPDHPLAGTVLGASEDEAALRDTAIAEALLREHTLARGSLTIAGDIDEAHARKLAEALLSTAGTPDGAREASVGAHPREDQLTVDESVPAPRVLVGWIGPGEGEVGDASLRVALEILDGKQTHVLSRALVDETRAATEAHAKLEIGARASVATVELTPSSSKDIHATVRALDAEIARLAENGPSGNDVAVAKWMIHARLVKEQAKHSAGKPGEVHSAGVLGLRHALRPWAAERAMKSLDEVTLATVRTAIRRVLAPTHRVVVVTLPRGAR